MTKGLIANFVKEYTIPEEIAHSISHGLAMGFGIAALVLMLVKAQGAAAVTAAAIYGSTIIILFLSSTLYHAITHTKTKAVLKVVDHCSIYVLIAGSYTPFLLVSVKGALGIVYLVIIWVLALFGVLAKIFFFYKFKKFETALYLGMGWLAIGVFSRLMQNLDFGGIVLLLVGGIVYSLGVFFYLADSKIPFNHFIWHLFVLGGAVCHFVAVYVYVIG